MGHDIIHVQNKADLTLKHAMILISPSTVVGGCQSTLRYWKIIFRILDPDTLSMVTYAFYSCVLRYFCAEFIIITNINENHVIYPCINTLTLSTLLKFYKFAN